MAGTDDTAPTPKGKSRMKVIVLAAAGLGVVLAGGGGAAYMLGLFGGSGEAPAVTAEESAHEAGTHGAAADEGVAEGEHPAPNAPVAVFVDIPDILVNLQSEGARMRFLRLRVSLEVADERAATGLRQLMPRIMDSFQMYLRALTVPEVTGATGLQRLKEELMARVNLTIEPIRVADVLFKEMLVQ